jgi:hypothetical protein
VEAPKINLHILAMHVQHVNNVFCSHIPRGSFGIGTTPKTSDTAVNNGNAMLKRNKNIGQGLAVCVVEVNSQLLGIDKVLRIKVQIQRISKLASN